MEGCYIRATKKVEHIPGGTSVIKPVPNTGKWWSVEKEIVVLLNIRGDMRMIEDYVKKI